MFEADRELTGMCEALFKKGRKASLENIVFRERLSPFFKRVLRTLVRQFSIAEFSVPDFCL